MTYQDQQVFGTDKGTEDRVPGKNKDTLKPPGSPARMASGVMNPYILAGIVLGKSPGQTCSQQEMMDAMNKFGGGKVSKFREIFDPRKSPIFSPPELKNFLSGFKETEIPYAGAQVCAGNPACENLEPVRWDIAATNCIRCGTRARASYINDVIQGACLNCYFMAALYSLAWTYYGSFPINLTPVDNYYTFTFYKYPDLTKVQVKIKATFPVNVNGHLVYAQETPQAELWPALYEKAYARFFPLNDSILPNAIPGEDPDISTFPPYVAIISLTQLTKLQFWILPKGGIPPTEYNPANLGGWGTSSYDVLIKYNILRDVTSWATVAWTHDSGSIPATALPFFYNPAIIPSHAYSVLGGFTSAAGVSYIVLRNPWGNKIDPVNDASLTPLKASLATGKWTPANGPEITFGSNADGIFALESSMFDKCFTGFGWVRP